MSSFAYGSCVCDLVMVDVTVSPLPKMAPMSGIFKVPYVQIQMSHLQEGFPDYTSPPTLHGSLT